MNNLQEYNVKQVRGGVATQCDTKLQHNIRCLFAGDTLGWLHRGSRGRPTLSSKIERLPT